MLRRDDTPTPTRYTPPTMTWVDGVVLAVLAISALVAFLRGMVHEVLGVGAWVGAALAGFGLSPTLSPILVRWGVEEPWVADALAIAGVFVLVLIILKVVIAAIARRVQDSALGGTDRALGLLFGLARGAFLVVIAYILGGMVLPATERWPDAVRDARSLPLAVEGAVWLADRLPPDYRPRVAVPPERPSPAQNDLMRPPARNRT